MQKIVFTGGPCCGKTRVLKELHKKYMAPILNETAKKIVAERKNIPMTKEESDIRQELIFQKQFKKETRAGKRDHSFLFLDRCLIDGLGYSSLYSGEESVQKYFSIVEKQKYDQVFLFELLDFNDEGFRAEKDKEEALKIEKSLSSMYNRFGYNPIYVPRFSLNKYESIEKRVDFVLEKVFEKYP